MKMLTTMNVLVSDLGCTRVANQVFGGQGLQVF